MKTHLSMSKINFAMFKHPFIIVVHENLIVVLIWKALSGMRFPQGEMG